MNDYNFPLVEDKDWKQGLDLKLCDNFSDWLLDPTSLTEKLKALNYDLEVEVLGEGFTYSMTSELNLWTREVLLKLDSMNVVFARTVIPDKIAPYFFNLGSRPLGEILYNAPNIICGDINLGTFIKSSKVASWLNANKSLPARQRNFYAKNERIMVYEVFLPKILELS